ncbi:MAG: methyltransferase domain-containing protein [Lachnospiraceae bacterium]|nr:methyltransferase domain-containing protein [Lachnospiraceae bacterium]
MNDAYQDFASVYDELMDNIPYEEWFEYLHSLLKEFNIDCGIIAELGCGTGSMTELMAQAGYDMIGIDNSPSMLDIANEKKAEKGSNSLYLCQDMREFELYGTVAATISICDSINYITEPDELLRVFRLVNNYLDPKGIFIFDFHPRHYYKEIVADSTIAEDRDDISFIWDNFYDEEEDINELYLSLFIKEKDDLYRKHEEVHFQRGYTLEEMKNLIKSSGLELLHAYDAFTKEEATEECERIYIIARESGK